MEQNANNRTRNVYLAIIASLGIHTLVLAILYFIHPVEKKSEEELLINMDFVELEQPLIAPNQLQNENGAEVLNRIANRNSEQSWDDLNYSSRAQEQMGEDVYEELKALEAETFAKLQEERGDEPSEQQFEAEEKAEDEDRDDYSWFGEERSYGAATVEFDLDGREGMKLPPPAYRCKGQGKVVVQISVERDGTVSAANILESTVNSECLEEEAVRYASKSIFNQTLSAPRKQEGTITYRFVAQ